jgi:tetratricopeptide (TPR) repeat protein
VFSVAILDRLSKIEPLFFEFFSLAEPGSFSRMNRSHDRRAGRVNQTKNDATVFPFSGGRADVSNASHDVDFGLCSFSGRCGGSGIADAERNERGSALYRKALRAEQSGDIKEAVRLFNKVLIEEPRSFSAHFQLATLLQDHEADYFGAIFHYRQYLALRPESEKGTLAQDRIRIAEQMHAPQILRRWRFRAGADTGPPAQGQ